MNKVKLYSNNALRLSLLGGFVLAATACSHSGGSASSDSGGNGANGDASTLQVITPKTIYSKPDVTGSTYVVINNPTNSAVKNLHYSLTNPIGSATKAVIDPVSAASCSTVAAYSQCNVKVSVAAGAVAGSLGFSVSNNGTLLSKLTKSAQAAAALASTMGIEQVAYNSLSGADGITLSYYNTVINGTPYILVSGLVASNNAGNFDKVVLVNGSGTEIPNQQLISTVSSAQGSTFNILLPVPSTNNASQTIKVQTQQNNVAVSTARASSTLSIQQNIGIANLLPSAVYLTTANPEQIITFANTGDVAAQLQQLVSNNPNVEVVFSPTSLTSGTTTTATLKLKNTAIAATSGNVTLTYNNGQSETSTSGSVDQNVNPAPSPTPTPTPTPAPTPPSPTPTPGLTAIFSPNNNFFKTTAGEAVTRQLTLTNTGNTIESGIILTLPANFSISSGTNNSCTVTQGTSPATISNTLAASTGSCDVTVTYTNSTVTPQASSDISIAYNYNNGTAAPTPTTAAVNYKVDQSTAILTLMPNPVIFTNVLNNNVESNSQTVTVTNSGDIAANNLAFSVTGTNSNLFSIIAGGSCVSNGSLSNTTGSNTCTIYTQFGTIASSVGAGAKTASLDVGYTPYPSGTSVTASTLLNGQVVTAQSANIAQGTAIGSGFAGGDGSSTNQFQIMQNAVAPSISYTITNSGAVPATDFYISGTANNWTIGGNCGTSVNKITLAAGNGSCNLIFTLNSTATTGSQDLNVSGMTMYWVDQDSPTGQNQNMSGTQYVNVYAPAAIAITTTPASNISVAPENSFSITANLSGGYAVAAQTIHAALTTGTTDDISFANNDCALNSQNSYSCTIIVTAAVSASAATGNVVTLSNTTSNPAATPNPSTVTFAIAKAGESIALPQTGQTPTSPITATVGMDGYSYIGVPWAYVSSGSTTPATRFTLDPNDANCMIDNLTGLEWVTDLDAVAIKGSAAGSPTSWQNALDSITDINTAGYCGHSDWYLPTVNDLASLINYGFIGGANKYQSQWLILQNFQNVRTNSYWSSSTYASSTTSAWYVNFTFGGVGANSKTDNNYVWPVRLVP